MAINHHRHQQGVHLGHLLSHLLGGQVLGFRIQNLRSPALAPHVGSHETGPDRRLNGGELLAQGLIDRLTPPGVDEHQIRPKRHWQSRPFEPPGTP